MFTFIQYRLVHPIQSHAQSAAQQNTILGETASCVALEVGSASRPVVFLDTALKVGENRWKPDENQMDMRTAQGGHKTSVRILFQLLLHRHATLACA